MNVSDLFGIGLKTALRIDGQPHTFGFANNQNVVINCLWITERSINPKMKIHNDLATYLADNVLTLVFFAKDVPGAVKIYTDQFLKIDTDGPYRIDNATLEYGIYTLSLKLPSKN